LSGAYSQKHGTLKTDLSNRYLAGDRDAYPKTVAQAMELMEGWTVSGAPHQQQNRQRNDEGGDNGLSFAQVLVEEESPEEEQPLEEVPTIAAGSALKSRRRNRKNKSILKFKIDATKDAAGNVVVPHQLPVVPVIPAQSHATSGEEEEEEEVVPPEQAEECPHCNGAHNLTSCPEVSLELLDQIHAQLCEEEESDVEEAASFFQEGAILLSDQKQIKTGGLRQNRLYLDTCTTSELMASSAFLTKIFQSATCSQPSH